MAKKARKTLTFVEKMQKFVHAGISESAVPNRLGNDMEDLSSLDERIKRVLGIVNRSNRPASNMLFFVMYDIENNERTI